MFHVHLNIRYDTIRRSFFIIGFKLWLKILLTVVFIMCFGFGEFLLLSSVFIYSHSPVLWILNAVPNPLFLDPLKTLVSDDSDQKSHFWMTLCDNCFYFLFWNLPRLKKYKGRRSKLCCLTILSDLPWLLWIMCFQITCFFGKL